MSARDKYGLLTFLYFIEGLPYGIQTHFLPIYLHNKDKRSATSISLLKLANTPWLLKFVWGPLVDEWGSRRRWIFWTSALLTLITVLCSQTSSEELFLFSLLIFTLNLITSVQDVAIDATAFSILNINDLALVNVAQVVGYKLGAIFSGGVLTSYIDLLGWTNLFLIIAICYLFAFTLAFTSPTLKEQEKKELTARLNNTFEKGLDKDDCKKLSGTSYCYKFYEVLNRDTMWILIFLFCYKLGEQGSFSILPLYLLDKNIPANEIVLWLNIIGQTLSIIGSTLGGLMLRYMQKKCSLKFLLQRVLMIRLLLAILQNAIIIFWDAQLLHTPHSLFFYGLVTLSQLQLLTSGVLTTLTFTIMMQHSKNIEGHLQATCHATLSTVEVLGKLSFTSGCGYIVDTGGYVITFVIFTLLNILVIPMLKYMKFDSMKIH